jgi:hypothetical protein
VAATARPFRGVSALSRELGKASRLFRSALPPRLLEARGHSEEPLSQDAGER